MPKNPEKAAKAKEKAERKALEAKMKVSREKVEEAKLLMDPPDPKAQPNYVKAIAVLDAALEWPDNGDAYRLRGDCHREQKALDVAIENYTSALGLNDKDLNALEGRGTCFINLKRWDDALGDFSKMIEINPALDHPYNMRATARLHKRAPGLRLRNAELALVIEDLTKSIHANPNNFHATCNLAGCLDEHGMYLDAIEQYTNAIRLKEEYAYAYYRRGVAILALVEGRRNDDAAQDRKQKDAAADAKREEQLRRQELAHEGKVASAATPKVAADGAVVAVSEADVEAALQAERAAEAKQAEESRLLNLAVADFTRVLPSEEIQTELPALLHRATCFMLLGQLDKAAADVKVGASFLDPLKSPADIAEQSFGGIPAAMLKDVLAIRKASLAQLQAKERRMAGSILGASVAPGN